MEARHGYDIQICREEDEEHIEEQYDRACVLEPKSVGRRNGANTETSGLNWDQRMREITKTGKPEDAEIRTKPDEEYSMISGVGAFSLWYRLDP